MFFEVAKYWRKFIGINLLASARECGNYFKAVGVEAN